VVDPLDRGFCPHCEHLFTRPELPAGSWAIRRQVQRLVGAGPDGFLTNVRQAIDALQKVEAEAKAATTAPAPLLREWAGEGEA
jgi:hypothetical protein